MFSISSPNIYFTNICQNKIEKSSNFSLIQNRLYQTHFSIASYIENLKNKYDFIGQKRAYKDTIEIRWMTDVCKNSFLFEGRYTTKFHNFERTQAFYYNLYYDCTFEKISNYYDSSFFQFLDSFSAILQNPINNFSEFMKILIDDEHIEEIKLIGEENNANQEEKLVETVEEINKNYDFEGTGFAKNSLSLYDIKSEYFESLSEESKKDVLLKARNEFQMKETVIKETLNKEALNKKLLISVIRENAALSKISNDNGINSNENISEDDWKKICSSINELDEDNKSTLIKQLPYKLIQCFPKELKIVAKKLRKNYVDFYRKRELVQENADSCSSSLQSISEQDVDNGSIFENVWSEVENKICEEKKENKFLFEECEKNIDFEKIYENFDFYNNFPEIDDESLILLINHMNSYFKGSDSKECLYLKSYLKSLALIPKNAYKLIDAFAFLLSFYEDYDKACQDESDDYEKIKNTQFFSKLFNKYITVSGSSVDLSQKDISQQAAKLFDFLFSKKIALPLLSSSYTIGYTALIYENSTYQSSAIIQEIRTILSHRKHDIFKETVLDKTLKYYVSESKETEFMISLKDILAFETEAQEISQIPYPKILSKMSSETYLKYFTNKIDLNTFIENFEFIETMISKNFENLIEIVVNVISDELNKWTADFNDKKKKFLNFKESNQNIEKDIVSIENKEIKKRYFHAIENIFYENFYELKWTRKNINKILKKFRTATNKFCITTAKVRVDSILNSKNSIGKEFYRLNEEIISKLKGKIYENKTIVYFFKDYFELWDNVFKLVGKALPEEDYEWHHHQELYDDNKHILKLFMILYSFLNPISEECDFGVESIKKEEKQINSLNDPFKNYYDSLYKDFSFFVQYFLEKKSSNRTLKTYFHYLKYNIEDLKNTNFKYLNLKYLLPKISIYLKLLDLKLKKML